VTDFTADPASLQASPGDAEALYPVDEVRALFVTFGKALRAFQLYDENNPVYQRFVSALRDAFTHLWTELDELTVAVQEDALIYEGVEAYRVSSRSESVAFLMYKDGVRELTILPGVESELEAFLGVLQKARQARADGDDLLTLLWEADLQRVKYFYVDLLAEGVDVPEPGEPPTKPELQAVLEEELEDGEPRAMAAPLTPTPELVSREDFNPTLYALDPREMDELRAEITREMERDVRSGVLAALLDRLEEARRPARQSEILDIVHTLLPTLLSRGALRAAGDLLGELRDLEARGGLLDGERAEELARLIDDLSSGGTMQELVRALEDGSLAPAPRELGAFLQHLRAGALAPLLRATELTERRELQPVLREAVQGIASRHLRELTALLAHDDPVVVAGAARLAAGLKIQAVTGALGALFRHEDAGVRLAAVEAAVELRASTVASGLEVALDDPEREVRIAAVRALGTLRYRPAARRLKEVLQSRELRGSDLSERIAFFESYGDLAADEAIGYLDRLLNGRGFLGRRESPEIRACAALGLGRIQAAEARRALEEAVREEDPVVRSAVNRALRGGGEA
jgi:hypothetical protein